MAQELMQELTEFGLVREAGGTRVALTWAPKGMLVWFCDPVTNSTLAMYQHEITSADAVRRHIAQSRAKFGVAVPIEKPVTLAGAARLFGLTRATLRQWLREDGFPMPGAGSKAHNVLSMDDVAGCVAKRMLRPRVQTSAKDKACSA